MSTLWLNIKIHIVYWIIRVRKPTSALQVRRRTFALKLIFKVAAQTWLGLATALERSNDRKLSRDVSFRQSTFNAPRLVKTGEQTTAVSGANNHQWDDVGTAITPAEYRLGNTMCAVVAIFRRADWALPAITIFMSFFATNSRPLALY